MADKYNELLEKVDWYFETEDALRCVRFLLYKGRTTLNVYNELAMWAGDAESELRDCISEGHLVWYSHTVVLPLFGSGGRTRDAVQIPLQF